MALPTAAGQACRAIKRETLSNRLRPVDPVPIGRFLRELGISRTRIRQAVLLLECEELIEARPRFGTFVSHHDIRRTQECAASGVC